MPTPTVIIDPQTDYFVLIMYFSGLENRGSSEKENFDILNKKARNDRKPAR